MSMDRYIGQLDEVEEIIKMCENRYSESVEPNFIKWLIERRDDLRDKIATELDYLEDYYLGGE